MRNLDSFFNPKSIAIIGATSDPKKFGNALTSNILSNNRLNSEIFLVSRRNQIIRGFRTYNSVLEIPREVELAIILIPTKIVNKVVNQ